MEPEHLRAVLDEFKAGLRAVYGTRLRDVILYGSYARGQATEDSDIDVLFVLGGEVRPSAEVDRVIDLVTDIGLKHRVLLSVYPVSETEFRERHSPLLLNVRAEGIPA